MENKNIKNKNTKGKNFLTYLTIGLFVVCVGLLVAEISINTAAEIKAIQSFESHSVAVEDPSVGE